jgi:hypothetical protein
MPRLIICEDPSLAMQISVRDSYLIYFDNDDFFRGGEINFMLI